MNLRPFRLAAMLLALFCPAIGLTSTALADTGDNHIYSIEVDVTNQITTVYRNRDRSIVRQMICSTGINDNTPLGTFRMEQSRPTTDRMEWYYITQYGVYVKYASRIKGGILFHSIPYAEKDMTTIDREALALLGTKASHGCIRLLWEDARWISENCPDGTAVTIFYSPAKKDALRNLLLVGSYRSDSGLTYRQFISAAPEGFVPGGLGRGDRGEEVTALQLRLTGMGFYTGSDSGLYDDATVVAVMRYQRAAGMTVTGVASDEVIHRIMAESDVAAEYSTLTPGCSGTLVVKLQRAMQRAGLYDGEIDGVYGPALAEAVTEYCAAAGIEPTRQVTPAMRSDIYGLADEPDPRFS